MSTSRVPLSIVFALVIGVVPASSPGAGIDAGVASVEITPPLGYRMAGYFGERLNTGTRDPLYAKAVVFRQGDRQAALVFCDLVNVPRALAAQARDEAARLTGIPAERITVAATHSHTGPLYDGPLRAEFHRRAVAGNGRDEREAVDYPSTLVRRVAEAVAAAHKTAGPVRLEAGFAHQTSLAFNRRFHMKDGTVRFNPGALNPEIVRPAGPTDPEIGVLLIRPAEGGQPVAALTVFALHLDTVGGTEYSADYPFFLQEELRRAFGHGFVSLFGAGTCGDINHIDVTRRERASAETIGRTLARNVLESFKALDTLTEPSLEVSREFVEVPLQRYSPDEVTKAREVLAGFDKDRTPFLETVRAVKIVDLADNYPADSDRLEVQAIRLGSGMAVVTLPGEVFVEHGLAIKRASPFKTTLVVELANANPAYIPTRKAVDEGSYEIVNSRFAPGGGERLVEAAVRLLKRLNNTGR